eukprot:TRINITY_DN3876_c0_g1_i1.p2 TRINITY_DN3876_c0_g1~~TRINITY_DN3876_c0_g1_i1.p2  ORF type:complete len:266 (+),score=77.53 TRINITY_DN3876_c0_g1_i1:101-799(+)
MSGAEPYGEGEEPAESGPCLTLWMFLSVWCAMCTAGVGIGVAYLEDTSCDLSSGETRAPTTANATVPNCDESETARIIFFSVTTFCLAVTTGWMVKKCVGDEADKLADLLQTDDESSNIDAIIGRVEDHTTCCSFEETWALRHALLQALRRIKQQAPTASTGDSKQDAAGAAAAAHDAAPPAPSPRQDTEPAPMQDHLPHEPISQEHIQSLVAEAEAADDHHQPHNYRCTVQ